MPGDSPQVSEAEAQVLYWATGSTDSWSDVWHRGWPFCLAGQAVRRSTDAIGARACAACGRLPWLLGASRRERRRTMSLLRH